MWNLDKTGLFWHGLPTKTLAAKTDQAKGRKLAKKKTATCFLASRTGKKFILLIIGKSIMPQAFWKVLPIIVIWQANKKVWMTCDLFEEYILNFNDMM